MMLWDLIRDFFVENIFGGVTSNDVYIGGLLGQFANEYYDYDLGTTDTIYVNVGRVLDGNQDIAMTHIAIGDWLSTTFTIITLVLLIIFLYIFVKWMFKLFAGLLSH